MRLYRLNRASAWILHETHRSLIVRFTSFIDHASLRHLLSDLTSWKSPTKSALLPSWAHSLRAAGHPQLPRVATAELLQSDNLLNMSRRELSYLQSTSLSDDSPQESRESSEPPPVLETPRVSPFSSGTPNITSPPGYPPAGTTVRRQLSSADPKVDSLAAV